MLHIFLNYMDSNYIKFAILKPYKQSEYSKK